MKLKENEKTKLSKIKLKKTAAWSSKGERKTLRTKMEVHREHNAYK